METPAPEKWALVVGIDRYPMLERRDADGAMLSHKHLAGCVNDARVFHALLTSEAFGFPPDHVTLLTDEAATRDGILHTLDALIDRMNDGDVFVWTYAGHGSVMRDREGDEADGLDSTLVPSDSGRYLDERNNRQNRDITDDEIYLRLLRLKKKRARVTLIFDACQSGTIARDVLGGGARFIEDDTRSLAGASRLPVAAPEVPLADRAATGESGWLPGEDWYTLIAACRVTELAQEYTVTDAAGTRVTHGLMSYHLAQELRRAGPETTYRDVFERMLPVVRSTALARRPTSPQHPQMEGARDRVLFGILDLKPMPYARLDARDGDTVRLAAGAAGGARVGSIWEVYPPDTRTTGGPALGQIRLTGVDAVSAEGVVVEEAARGAITAACRAVETTPAPGAYALRYRVDAPPEAVAAFEAARAETPGGHLLAPAETAPDVRVHLLPPRATAADPLPALGPLAEATWALEAVDPDALLPGPALLAPAHPAADPDALPTTVENLVKVARVQRLQALIATQRPGPLTDAVRVTLLRRQPDGRFVPAEPSRGGLPVFRAGEHLTIHLTNTHDRPVYVTLLNLGLDHSVVQIYPVPGASEALQPAGDDAAPFDVGASVYGPEGIGLFWPETVPGTEGLDTLIVFVTLDEADFTPLTQAGTRSLGSGSSLSRQVAAFFGAGGTRNLAAPAPARAPDWAVAMASFMLVR